MTRTKKFKTISGYLRSAETQMLCAIPWDASDDARNAAIRRGQRNIINNLLPQLELATLDPDETPRDGIERLLKIAGNERQTKALKDCRRWIHEPVVAIKSVSVTMNSATPTTWGMIYRGYDIKKIDDAFVISKNGEVASTQPSEDAAREWINPRADAAVRRSLKP